MQPSQPLPYEPGTATMPALPPNYRSPLPIAEDRTVMPEGDIERLVGGDVFCETYLERDLIPAIYRREGITLAYVKQDSDSGELKGDSYWYLRGGIDNTCWVPSPLAGQGAASAGGQPAILRGGDADPGHFQPAARHILY